MAAILFTACTQDELAEQGNTLPDGEYPLQIGRVSITAEASEEPWTRVSESTDGKSSVWETNDEFYVKFEGSDEVGIYKITDAATGAVKPVKSIYWKNTQPAKIIAWYANPQPNEANWMYFDDQDRDGLAYLLRAEQTAAYGDTPVSLQFTHQFAKLRVVTKGTAEVGQIIAKDAHTWCLVQDGEITRSLGSYSYMYKKEYEGIGTCWEINAAPCDIEIFDVSPEGEPLFQSTCRLDSPTTLAAGTLNVVTITAHRQGTQTIDLSTLTDTRVINDNGIYYVTGTGQYGIQVTNGNPEIYLEDAQISVSGGNAIDITGGNPTIHVRGEGNTVSSSNGAGIYVAESRIVTIQGNSTEDALTCEGDESGAGIGGYYSGRTVYSCGNINISNVTITARCNSVNSMGDGFAGIGAAGNASVGSINISNSIINAIGSGSYLYGAAAIGGGSTGDSSGQTEFDITISNSEIHATKGSSHASYIGAGGDITSRPANYDIISTARITSSSIYNESGTEITQ